LFFAHLSARETIVPITASLAAVFVSVSNMATSVDWYGRLLGLPDPAISHQGQICELPLDGSTTIILDSHGSEPIVPSVKPLLMFEAPALEPALTLARSMSGTVTTPEDIGSVVVFYLTDPDSHRICIKVPKG
jgi:catechol 2,3-dioxygenase-like lactoylglutathione lyase family enzyme